MRMTLRQWRRFKNESIETMAKACDCSPMTYAEWEKNPGKIKAQTLLILTQRWEIAFEDIIFLPEDATNSTENVE